MRVSSLVFANSNSIVIQACTDDSFPHRPRAFRLGTCCGPEGLKPADAAATAAAKGLAATAAETTAAAAATK